MNTTKQSTRIAGALFLISYFGTFAGGFTLQALLDAPEMLSALHTQSPQITLGVLLETLNGVAVLGIAVMLYPILKETHKGIALGYVSVRILEAVTQLVMSLGPLLMVTLSQQYAAADFPANDPYFTHTQALLLGLRDAGSLMLLVFFALGAALFYILLYQSKLVPRFIPIWGWIACTLVVVANTNLVPAEQTMIFALPIIANEIFIAFWLLIKGFNSPTKAAA